MKQMLFILFVNIELKRLRDLKVLKIFFKICFSLYIARKKHNTVKI